MGQPGQRGGGGAVVGKRGEGIGGRGRNVGGGVQSLIREPCFYEF